ncbi:hypothetical protein [Bacillus phage FI_KG-Lek]|nr:hypothetical protein [Bacillus phage FI_KG-Lek]
MFILINCLLQLWNLKPRNIILYLFKLNFTFKCFCSIFPSSFCLL